MTVYIYLVPVPKHFQSLLLSLGQSEPNFMWHLHRLRELQFVQMVSVFDPGWPPPKINILMEIKEILITSDMS